jgi:hypothetical protein
MKHEGSLQCSQKFATSPYPESDASSYSTPSHPIFLRFILILSSHLFLGFPQQWKESIIIPIYKKGNKTDCNTYRGISLLSTAYKILSNILLARLTLYVNEIIGDHQCGFRHNRSTTDQIFYIRQILEK